MAAMRKVASLVWKCIPDSVIRLITDWIGMLIRIEVSSEWTKETLIPLDQRITRIETNLKVAQSLQANVTSNVDLEKINSQFGALAEKLEYLENLPQYPLLNREEYKKLEARFHTLSSSISDAHFDVLLHSLPKSGRVLEFGCGKGLVLKRLKDHNNSLELVGVDLIAYEEWLEEDLGVDFVEGDGIRFLASALNQSLAGVMFLHVVEHLNNLHLRMALEQVFRALEPGGQCVIETPNVQSTFTLTRYYFVDPTHVSPRHPALYAFLLESLGFCEVEIVFLENHEVVLDTIDTTTKDFLLSGSANILIRGTKPSAAI